MKQVNNPYDAFDKWTHEEELNEHELFLILTHDWTEDVDYFEQGGFLMTFTQYHNMVDILTDYASSLCEYWEDAHDDYGDNPYNWGYILDGHYVAFGYTGVAGKWWTVNKAVPGIVLADVK